MARYCADTTVAFIIALNVEAPESVLIRERKGECFICKSGDKGKSCGIVKRCESRAERGEEGLRLLRMLFAGTSMEMYCVGIIATSTFANSPECLGRGICSRNNNRFSCKMCRDHR